MHLRYAPNGGSLPERQEAIRFVELFTETQLGVPVRLAFETGLRLGEVFGLRWSDVDLDRGEIAVRQSLQISGAFDTPKTPSSASSVDLPIPAAEALRRHRVEQSARRLRLGESWCDLDLVFERGDGRPINTQWASRRFSALARANGYDLTFHALRHLHATLMHAGGIDLKTISERLRHSNYQITADLYTQVNREVQRQAVTQYEKYMGYRTSGEGAGPG